MTTYTSNVFDFIKKVMEHTRYVTSHISNDTPINYEISESGGVVQIKASYINDLVYKPELPLYEAMEVIADWTNNEMCCGCTFTIGW